MSTRPQTGQVREVFRGSTMTTATLTLAALQEKGWTLAAIADALGIAHNTVEKWKAGDRTPHGQKMVMASLNSLLRQRSVPKKRRYMKPKDGI